MTAVIRCKDLVFNYYNTQIFDQLNLEITEKEFSCFIGPNGSGKSTLLQLIMGFVKPQKGIIEVFGKSPKLARRWISYVPQHLQYDHLFPISVFDVVISGRIFNTPWWHSYYSKTDKEKTHELMNQLGIYDFRHRPFGKLSGGQRQRTLIARALVSNPKLLLLDEPTASVDIKAGKDIYACLHLIRNSLTIIMVTHDMAALKQGIDKVYCFHGQVESFKPEDLCQHHAYGLYHNDFQEGNPRS